MKNLKELKGVKLLNKKEQKAVIGGQKMCLMGPNGYYCPSPYICKNGICVVSPV